ncbi:hypothetical protein Ddc_00432 [Ditylenchus destructor]|nr:hypothetical protein Ddc_00432 [Ditylenchus destructor]
MVGLVLLNGELIVPSPILAYYTETPLFVSLSSHSFCFTIFWRLFFGIVALEDLHKLRGAVSLNAVAFHSAFTHLVVAANSIRTLPKTHHCLQSSPLIYGRDVPLREKTVVDLSQMAGRQIAYVSYYSSSSGSSSSEDEESTPHDSGTEQGDCSRKNKATKKAKKSKNSTSKDKQQANGKVPKDSVNGTSKSKHQPLTTSEIRIVDRNEKENVPSSPHPKAASSSPQTKSEKKKPKNGPGTPARTSSAKEVAEREEASKTRDSTSPKSKEKNENGTKDVKIRNKENGSPSTRSNCKSECAETASTSITRQITAGTSIIVVANNKEYEHKDIAAEPRPTLHSTRRLSPAVKRTSVLVLEDRPLPELPPDASDSEEQPEDDDLSAGQELSNDAVYINTRTPGPGRTSTNDSGIGGSSTAPQDYANANIPLKPTKVSQKIQQLLMTLQVGSRLKYISIKYKKSLFFANFKSITVQSTVNKPGIIHQRGPIAFGKSAILGDTFNKFHYGFAFLVHIFFFVAQLSTFLRKGVK